MREVEPKAKEYENLSQIFIGFIRDREHLCASEIRRREWHAFAGIEAMEEDKAGQFAIACIESKIERLFAFITDSYYDQPNIFEVAPTMPDIMRIGSIDYGFISLLIDEEPKSLLYRYHTDFFVIAGNPDFVEEAALGDLERQKKIYEDYIKDMYPRESDQVYESNFRKAVDKFFIGLHEY